MKLRLELGILRKISARLARVLVMAGLASTLAALLTGCGSSSASGGNQTPPLSITTSSLPTVQVGVAYNTQLAAAGGTPPYIWSLASGNLPPGLTLASNGAIAGTATAAGTFNISVMVTDSLGAHQTASYSMSVVIGTDAFGGFTAMPVLGCTQGGY